MLAEGRVQLTCPLYCLHLQVSERHPADRIKAGLLCVWFCLACPSLSWFRLRLAPDPPGDLFLTPV